MDPYKNPFSPGAGSPPPELAGRDDLLRQAEITLARTKAGRYEQSMLLVGLRGVGKAVLLNREGTWRAAGEYRDGSPTRNLYC